ncbi:putative inactive lipase [Gordonia sp. MP11Mi]|uniref:Inactive lipase n=1 Tax=Gordonia sp. MP11Mi TaxID=3022769 RepID=A0AA97GUE1_9ACTN
MTVVALSAGVSVAAPHASAERDFYLPPADFSASPGSVIRTEKAPLVIDGSPGTTGIPATATRMMYTSTLQNGAKTAVTGFVVESTAKWHGGERPTVVVGPGTMGQGDQCAGSRVLSKSLAVDPAKPSVAMNSASSDIAALVDKGIRVVVTDYIGLGTPGVHTYVNRVETAHAMLDAARAGLRVAHAPRTAPVGFFGYSQGGGAAAAAAELAEQYAPELAVKGTYAGAPPADLAKVIGQIDGTTISGAIGYAVNGMTARYPELKAILAKETNPAGKRALATIATQCIGDTAATYGFQHTSRWTRTGESLGALINRYPAARKAVDAQRIGRLTPNAPVLLATSINDDVIPTGQVDTLYRDWRAKGANVKIIHDHTPAVAPGSVIGHAAPMQTLQEPAVEFLVSAFRR